MISKVSRDSRRAAHTLGRELKVMNDYLIDYGWKRYGCVLIVGDRLTPVIPSHAFPVVNVFREDEVRESMDRELILQNAPAKKDGCFLVPKTVE